jgi:hypothetical protein
LGVAVAEVGHGGYGYGGIGYGHGLGPIGSYGVKINHVGYAEPAKVLAYGYGKY